MATKILRKLAITRVALVEVGSNPQAEILLFKSKAPQPGDKEFTDMKIDATKYSKEEVDQLKALLAKGGVTVEAEPVPEEVLKTLAPEIRAMVEKAQSDATQAIADAKAATDQAKEATATAVLEKAAREESEFVAKSQDIVKAYPGEVDASTRLLYRVKKAIKAEDFTALEVLLKAGNTALAAATGDERGHGQEGQTQGTAFADLKKKAEDIQKTEKIPFSKAFDRACDENPELVKEYRAERGSSAQ